MFFILVFGISGAVVSHVSFVGIHDLLGQMDPYPFLCVTTRNDCFHEPEKSWSARTVALACMSPFFPRIYGHIGLYWT